MINIDVFDTSVRATVDSGSTSSLIKYDVALKFIKQYNLKISKCNKNLRSVTGDQLDLSGTVDINFIVNNQIITHNLIICRDNSCFSGSILFGLDFLIRMHAKVDFKKNFVRMKQTNYKFVNNKPAPCVRSIEIDKSHAMTYARNKKKCVIPMCNAKLINLNVPSFLNGKTVVVSPSYESEKLKLILPNTLSEVSESQIIVSVFNLHDEEIIIPSNIRFAKIEIAEYETEPPALVKENVGMSFSKAVNPAHSVIENVDRQHMSGTPDGYCNYICTDTNDISSHSLIDKLDLDYLDNKDANSIKDLLRKHKDVISINDQPGFVDICPHKIHVPADTIPINTPQYRIPFAAKKLVEDHTKKMLDAGIIEECASPWNSPILLIKKKQGDFRFCVDFRNINKIIKKDLYPLPRIDDTLESLEGASIFTTLDMKSSFHQIALDEDSRDITAFKTSSGSYRFKRSPQGLSTSPAAYQRACNLAFNKQLGKFMYAYMDDLIIHSKTFDEHLSHIEEVFVQMRATGFKLGLEKCKFAAPSVKYLGHIVDKDGICVDPMKVQAISEIVPPKTVREVRSFLGACGYYRRFVKDYAKIASPLHGLTKKKTKFIWNNECQEAFDILKDRLVSAPILAYPDFTKEMKLHCDASRVAIGGVLNQIYPDGERAIGYFSRKLRGPELNYSTTELEALAIFESVKFFNPYLYLNRFKIVTDHAALKFMFRNKNTNPRVARWAVFLASYDYEIFFRPGKSNVVPDMLSRANVEDCNDVVGHIDEVEDPLNFEVLIAEQRADPLLSKLIKYLSGEDVAIPKRFIAEEYFLEDKVLYRIPSVKNKVDLNIQVVIPKKLVSNALKLSHDSIVSTHMGFLRTLHRARKSFYWPNMTADIRRYVSSCIDCQKRKWQGKEHAALGEFPSISYPLERVGVDLIEMTPSYSGNKYILTIVDHFSKYVTAYALPDKSADTVTNAMLQFITQNSVPKEIVSDRGSEFTNSLFQKVCKYLMAKSKLTTSYHPMANGMCEKMNGTIKKTLSHLAKDDRFTWDDQLPFATLAINTSFQSSICEIPFFLFHGRDARLPFNDFVNKIAPINYSEDNYAEEMLLRQHKAFAHVKDMMKSAHDTSARYYNRKSKETNITVGSLVLLSNVTNKTDTALSWPTRYIGPYRVLRRFNNNFVIKGVYADTAEQTVHVNRLKLAKLRGDVAYPFNNHDDNDANNVNSNDLPFHVPNNVEQNVDPVVAEAELPAAPVNISNDNDVPSPPRYNLRRRRNR